MSTVWLMIVALAALAGCAQSDTDISKGHGLAGRPVAAGLSYPEQRDAADDALLLKREADRLRDMAQRREREALILSEDPNADQALIRQKREVAQHLYEEASQTDQESRALSRQVPHTMVQ